MIRLCASSNCARFNLLCCSAVQSALCLDRPWWPLAPKPEEFATEARSRTEQDNAQGHSATTTPRSKKQCDSENLTTDTSSLYAGAPRPVGCLRGYELLWTRCETNPDTSGNRSGPGSEPDPRAQHPLRSEDTRRQEEERTTADTRSLTSSTDSPRWNQKITACNRSAGVADNRTRELKIVLAPRCISRDNNRG